MWRHIQGAYFPAERPGQTIENPTKTATQQNRLCGEFVVRFVENQRLVLPACYQAIWQTFCLPSAQRNQFFALLKASQRNKIGCANFVCELTLIRYLLLAGNPSECCKTPKILPKHRKKAIFATFAGISGQKEVPN